MMQRDIRYAPMAILGTVELAIFAIIISPLAVWVYALRIDVLHQNWGQFAADALIAPLGIIHGILLLFLD